MKNVRERKLIANCPSENIYYKRDARLVQPGLDIIIFRRFTMNEKRLSDLLKIIAEHFSITIRDHDEIDNRKGLLIPVPGREDKNPIYVEIELKR